MIDSIHTLFLTCQTPYPPIGGAAMRNWQNISILKEFGAVALFSVPFRINQVDLNHGQIPSGIKFWEDYAVDFIEPSKMRKAMWWFRSRRHYRVDLHYRKDIVKALDRALSKFQPDLVVLSEIWLHSYLKTIRRHKCKIILDEHNIEALLFAENYDLARGLKNKVKQSIEFQKIKAIEKNSIQQVDQVWCCSEIDGHRLRELYGDVRHVRVVSNGIDVAYYANFSAQGEHPHKDYKPHPQTLIFMGTFGYSPNRVAAQWLLGEIYPYLQQVYSDCRLILAGKMPTVEMLEAAKQNPNIIVTGMVKDLRPYLAIASVVVVPLLQGGGTRLKILEAFAANRPVVSTSKGAEGLKVQDGQHLLIRNGLDELVKGVCELWNNPERGQQLAKNALNLVKSDYSWHAIASQVNVHIQELLH